MTKVIGVIIGYFAMSAFQYYISHVFSQFGYYFSLIYMPLQWVDLNLFTVSSFVYGIYDIIILVILYKFFYKHIVRS